MQLRRISMLAIVALLALTLTVAFTIAKASAATLNAPTPYHTIIMFEGGTSAHGGNRNLVSLAELQRSILAQPSPCGITVSHKPPVIETLWRTTSEQASKLMAGEYITSTNKAVYFVVLRGPFWLDIIVPTGVNGAIVLNKIVEVFDAQTGNLLVCGTDSL